MGEQPEQRDGEHLSSDGPTEETARPHNGSEGRSPEGTPHGAAGEEATEEDTAAAPGETAGESGPEESSSEASTAAEETSEEGTAEEWDDLVLDEHFIREAEVNEPAARTRMLRERWRGGKAPEPQPWRADEPPAGWLFSKGRRRKRKRKRKDD